MTVEDLGFEIIDNRNDRFRISDFTLTKNNDVCGFHNKLYTLYKSVLLMSMSDENHLARTNALNPFRVKMTFVLNKMNCFNEKQRDYVENHIFSNVYLKDDKRIKKWYGKELSKLNCVSNFKKYRNYMVKYINVHPYLLKNKQTLN